MKIKNDEGAKKLLANVLLLAIKDYKKHPKQRGIIKQYFTSYVGRSTIELLSYHPSIFMQKLTKKTS